MKDIPFEALLKLFGMGHLMRLIFMRWVLRLPIFALYLYTIVMFGALLIIQRTYNLKLAVFFLTPCLLVNIWAVFLGIIEGSAIVSLIIQLEKIDIAWKEYEKMQMEEKLVQNTF